MASAVNSTACATVHAQRLRTATRAQRVMRDAWAKVRATGVTIREALRQAWAGERERDGSREHCLAPASPTRRRLIGGLAVLPLSVEARGTHPDFELLKLEEQRTLYAAAYEEAVARFEHLASGFCIEPPECMFFKPEDRDLGLSQYAIHREDGRILYYPVERGISSLRNFKSMANEEAAARAKEIVEAFDDWSFKEEQAYRRSGGYAAEQHENEIARSLQSIKSRILKTPASTIHGILIKANIIELSACPDEDITQKIKLLLADIRSLAQEAGPPRLPSGNHVLASALSK